MPGLVTSVLETRRRWLATVGFRVAAGAVVAAITCVGNTGVAVVGLRRVLLLLLLLNQQSSTSFVLSL